jgi:hypothetical protein
MKNSARISVASLVGERLAAIGAANLPAIARDVIEADVTASVTALIHRRVTGPMVGRAVAHALAASADTAQGREGGTPSPSSPGRTPSAQPDVAGPVTDAQVIEAADISAGAIEPPTGGTHDN